MDWIKEHIKMILIIIVIIFLITIIVLSSAKPGGMSPIGKAAQSVTEDVQAPVSGASNGISSFFSGLFSFRSIQKENYALQKENDELHEKLTAAELSQQQLEELRKLETSLNYENYDDDYKKVTANVVALDGSEYFNIFTINAGEKDGVKQDDMVVNSDGLVGRALTVGKDWTKVIGVVDSSNSVSFTLLRDPDVVGIISGDGSGGLTGYVFDDSKSVLEGDILITSGIGYYPAGIQIGKVTSVDINSGTKEKTIEADSLVNFNSLRIVTVLVK